jgi:hypothetical protein
LPFKNTLKAQYILNYSDIDDYLYTKNIVLNSEVKLKTLFNISNDIKAKIHIMEGKINSIEVNKNNKTTIAQCEIL